MKSLLFLLIFLTSVRGWSQNFTIFEVKKNLPLNDSEPVYRDFYINAGLQEGFKKGMLVEVRRRSVLYDSYQNKNPETLVVPVGLLKLIHVQPEVSVGRVYKIYKRKDLPVLDYNFFLVGDQVVLKKGPKGSRKKSASHFSRKPISNLQMKKAIALKEKKRSLKEPLQATQEPVVETPRIQ
ncbi:MAG: hypothetical protein D6797_00105 [Bdellovibrio sp.]|nr:MAG: hypothetical protein D6797_00105 [Bdellovibrio sp.]